MDCSKFEELIELYLDGELDEDMSSQFEAHLNDCENCRDSYNFSKQIRNTLHNLPPITVPADFSAELNKRLDSEIKKQEKVTIFPVFRIPSKYYEMAACLLLAVVLGFNSHELLKQPTLEEVTVINENNTSEPTSAPAQEQQVPATNPTEVTEAEIPAPTEIVTTTDAPEVKEEVVITSTPKPVKVKPAVTPTEQAKIEKRDEMAKVKEHIDSSNFAGRVVIASAVEKSVNIDEDSVTQAEKDIDYRKNYTLLQKAVENKSIANDATLGAMKNVKLVSDDKNNHTGAFGASVIVYNGDIGEINGILNKYQTRPVGEFYLMSEMEYARFLEELKANGINYTNTGIGKSTQEGVMFKLVIS